MENVNLEGTIPMEEQNTESVTEEPAAQAEPEPAVEPTADTEQQSGEDGAEPAEPDGQSPFLTVQFNHAHRDMTREEAVSFAQKGLLYDKISPTFSKLDYLAAQSGITVNQMADALMDAAENTQKQKLIAQFGDDEETIEEMMAFYQSRNKDKYDKFLADRAREEEAAFQAARTQRESSLSDQFLALQKEFPEIQTFAQVPEGVKRLAAEGKMELTAAYLLHRHQESKRIAAAAESSAAQSKTSTGSAISEEMAGSAAVDAFIRGVRQ